MTENGTSVNYSYDAWGRNWMKSRTGALAVYTYGFGDKMAEAASTFPGEASYAQYEYDGLGKRRREAEDYPGTADDRTTWHRWAGWDEISEHGAGASYWEVGAPRTTHLPGLAVLEGAAPATAEARYVLGDHLGSVRQLAGQTKAPLARYDYAPYGELSRSAGLPLTVGYTGHRWDQAVGQYFAPFRYYNPKTARWNMRDPLGFVDGPNVYAYVSGNPVTSADPLGLIKECDPNSDTYGNQRGKEDHNGQWPPRPGQSDTRWPKLPDNSDKLDEILDRPHTHIGDAPARDGKNGTPGRNKKAWEWGRNGFLIHENHLYDEETENNKSHREPHYHYQWKDKEGKKHSVKIMPGMRMPNPNCDW